MSFSALILFFLLFGTQKASSNEIFVTPHRTCTVNCKGDLTEPYDNLILALQAATNLDAPEIILLSSDTANHYALASEQDDSGQNLLYQFSGQMTFSFTTLKIKPFFCDEVGDSVLPANTKCVNKDEILIIFLKTLRMTIIVKDELLVQNIGFDGIEALSDYSNETSQDFSICTQKRKRCCLVNQMSSQNYWPGIACNPTSSKGSQMFESFFKLDDTTSVEGLNQQMSFEKIILKNFWGKSMRSFVQTSSNLPYNLTLNNCTFNDLFFEEGLIVHSNSSSVSSEILIKDTDFSQYNYWPRYDTNFFQYYNQDIFFREGYLLLAKTFFRGVISIVGSTFKDVKSVSRRKCEDLFLKDFFSDLGNFVLNGKFSNIQGSRSNLKTLCANLKDSNFVSSLVYIPRMDGSMIVENSIFKKIVGVEGSVIRIDGSNSQSFNRFQFINSTFDGNFAIGRFANILIQETAEPKDCPAVEIKNSKFLNAAGCPGSYGNVGILCSWTYGLWSAITDIFYSIQDLPPRVNVSDSLFQGNYLALSNSLAIIGSYSSVLTRNTFQENGGITGVLSLYSIYYAKFPRDDNLAVGLSFGQSTAVYLSSLYKLLTQENTFKGNWGPWQGSQALGVSLTILDWYNLYLNEKYDYDSDLPSTIQNPLQFENDKFIDHVGVTMPINPSYNHQFQCYTPPLITISNNIEMYDLGGTSFGVTPSAINLKGVKFINNIASYDVTDNCAIQDYQLLELNELMKNNLRYQTGLLKFLIPSEAQDTGPNNSIDRSPPELEIGLSFVDGEISNNKLLTGGCLFPTLRMRSYELNNLTIRNNQINPNKVYDFDDSLKNEPDLDDIINSRNSIFCGFQKNSVAQARNLFTTASNLRVENNIGVLFSLYPDEYNYFSLMNSIFINNTCEYGSTIVSLKDSKIISFNNIFLGNNNRYGIFFLTSATTLHSSVFTTYIQNDGIHASLAYVDDKGGSIQISSNFYSNTINPTSQLFADNTTPQGALFMLISSSLYIQNSIFKENKVYAGFVISVGSSTSLQSLKVSDHSIAGNSLVGNFLYGSNLKLAHIRFVNNSLLFNQSSQLQPSMFRFVVTKLNVLDLEVSQVPDSNIGAFVVGNKIDGTLTDVKLSNFRIQGDNSLVNLFSSNITFNNLQGDDITSLFIMSETTLTLKTVSIQNMRPNLDYLFLINMASCTLKISNLNYVGTLDRGNFYSLIYGVDSSLTVADSKFLDAIYGDNKIFNLRESSLCLVTRSSFEYTKYENPPNVFTLSSGRTTIIEKCIFSNTGRIIQDENTKESLNFVSNVILTSPFVKSIETNGNNINNFLDNYFIAQNNRNQQNLLPESHIHITDNANLINLQNNLFFSLLGLNGIIQIQALSKPYNMSSSQNIFIDNQGSQGGAFYFDSSFSSVQTNTPSANIDSSIFLLNKAQKSEKSSGKGGAIYLTTSNQIKQETSITKSFFIFNSAEALGGAIFFDFMPPKVDMTSRFLNNSANRLNHIGSYPVRLGYHIGNPPLQPSVLPNQPFIQNSVVPEFHKWKNIASGLITRETYTFALLDMFGQIVYDDFTSELELYPNGLNQESRYLFSTKLSIVAEAGLFIFENFELNYKIHESINITFATSAIRSNFVIPVQPPLVSINSSIIEVQFRGCGRGESVIKEENTISCVECQSGFWQTSPTQDASICESCNSLSTFCLGGDRVGPQIGYWRLNETSNIVNQCPIRGSCLGNEDNVLNDNSEIDPKGKCTYGYTGNLCSTCIPGWAKVGDAECTNCSTNAWYYLRVVLILVFQLFMIIQAIRGTLNLSKDLAENQNTSLNGSILIRILTNYFQLISLVGSIPVTWPSVIKNFSSVSNQVSSVNENVFTLDCMFSSDHVFGIRIVFFKLLLSIVGPFVLIIFGFVFWVVYFTIKKRPIIKNTKFTNNVVSVATVICFTMQPSAIQTGFSLFKCTNLYREDNPEYYFTKDYDVKCWEGSHLYWAVGFGIPSLIIWAIVLPFLVFNALRKNKNQLHTNETTKKYAFIYGGYTDQKYYWELVIMARKFLLIGLLIGTSFHSQSLEIYASILLIMFCYFIHVLAKPYTDLKLNRLERFSLISAGIINFCGLYFKFVPSSSALDLIVIICGLCGNLLFLVYFGMLYFVFQIKKIRQNQKVIDILTKIANKCTCLKSEKSQKIIKKLNKLLSEMTLNKNLKQGNNLMVRSEEETEIKRLEKNNKEIPATRKGSNLLEGEIHDDEQDVLSLPDIESLSSPKGINIEPKNSNNQANHDGILFSSSPEGKQKKKKLSKIIDQYKIKNNDINQEDEDEDTKDLKF